MRLRELIDALTKLETVCGADTETEAMAVGLSIKTEVSYENQYGYAHRATETRKAANLITIKVLERDRPHLPEYDAADHVSRIP